jgi:alpha-galactosidase
MGWNSWDSYGTTLTEAEFKTNADVLASALKPFGYQYAVVDIEWYTPHPPARGNYIPDPANVTLDAYGRFVPAPNRFPSSANGEGFKPLADYAHARGLRFGIHIMRGIPRLAVERNLPIGATSFHAADIADKANSAPWTGMTDTYGIDMSKPGAQAYYDSIVELYARWGVDYIKADDMAAPFHAAEIDALHRAIVKSGRRIVLSLSPGPAPLAEHERLQADAQLWRISGDFWDRWKDIQQHFQLMHDWQPYVGVNDTWPDADMLPLGHIALRGENGTERQSRLTHDEQRTLINLWAIFRSPLIMGGDLPSLLTEPDHWTLSLLTNRDVIALDQHSQNTRIPIFTDSLAVWTADDLTRPKMPVNHFVAVFNRLDTAQPVKLSWEQLGLDKASYRTVDLWTKKHDQAQPGIDVILQPHASLLLRLTELQ